MRSTASDYCQRFAFFFNDTATTEIYTLTLHDALPILARAAPMPLEAPVIRIDLGSFMGIKYKDLADEHVR